MEGCQQNQARYVELAARYFGLLVQKVEVSGSADLEERVAAARRL